MSGLVLLIGAILALIMGATTYSRDNRTHSTRSEIWAGVMFILFIMAIADFLGGWIW